MQHLYASVVKIRERKMVPKNGRPTLSWVDVAGLTYWPCRLDLEFMRPGKDAPPAINAGVVPDREGIMFCDVSEKIKAGMQVVTIDDSMGRQVVKGVFEIKEIPGISLDSSSQHHMEIKVQETVQSSNTMPDISNSVLETTPGPPPVEFP